MRAGANNVAKPFVSQLDAASEIAACHNAASVVAASANAEYEIAASALAASEIAATLIAEFEVAASDVAASALAATGFPGSVLEAGTVVARQDAQELSGARWVSACTVSAVASFGSLAGEMYSGLPVGIDRPPLSNQQIAAQSTPPGHPAWRENQLAGGQA